MKKHYPNPTHLPIALVVSVGTLFLALWQFSPDQRFTLFFINKAVAASAVILISLSYLMGPLVKLIPPFRPHVLLRKYLGVIGFFLVVVHIVTSLAQYGSRIPFKWYADHLWGVGAGILATLIFLGLFLSSNDRAYLALGRNTWKFIQRCGYLALGFTLLHIYIAAGSRWNMWIKGEVAMPLSLKIALLISCVLLVRALWIGIDKLFPHKK